MPSKKDILDLHFMDARYKLIDIAAFLDRVERHPGAGDFRLNALKMAIPLLLSDQPGRAKAILESFSDFSTEPAATAHTQGASGALNPALAEG